MDSKKTEVSITSPYAKGGPLEGFDTLISEWKKAEEHQALINAKNPRYKRFPECFESVCRDFLLNDSWTIHEAAHLISGYVPDRGSMPKGDPGTVLINKVENHLKRAVNVTLRPVQDPFIGYKKFAAKDLLKWAHGKNITLAPVLKECVEPNAKPVKTVRPKMERKDVRDRKEAQAEALRYYEERKEMDGKYPPRSRVVNHLCKTMSFLTSGLDDERVKRWVKDVDPERELKRQKYGNNE